MLKRDWPGPVVRSHAPPTQATILGACPGMPPHAKTSAPRSDRSRIGPDRWSRHLGRRGSVSGPVRRVRLQGARSEPELVEAPAGSARSFARPQRTQPTGRCAATRDTRAMRPDSVVQCDRTWQGCNRLSDRSPPSKSGYGSLGFEGSSAYPCRHPACDGVAVTRAGWGNRGNASRLRGGSAGTRPGACPLPGSTRRLGRKAIAARPGVQYGAGRRVSGAAAGW